MRLTAELIERVPQFTNPLKERELDLRGNKITQIENLGITEDGFDTIDLSDNEITKLENFPLFHRLKTIIAHNNRLCRIAAGLGKVLPRLETLALHNNHFKELSELEPLTDLPNLLRLSLCDNLVTKKPNYRLFVIAKCPKLKHLDFRKVKPKERKQAEDMFGQKKEDAAAPKAVANGDVVAPAVILSAEEQQRIMQQIEAATSYEEIQKLEERLLAGTAQ
nr:U2 small nuclear ribonucleoprotein A' [Euglena gracilis]|eukprot:EG_transcript_22467